MQLEAIAKKLTYRTIQVTEPAKFELAERAVTEPPPGKLRMRIEACGVYRSDIFAAQGDAVTAGFGMAAVGFANHYGRFRRFDQPTPRRECRGDDIEY